MQPPLDTILTKAFTMTDNIALLLSANMDIEALTESFAETLAPHHTSTCAVVI